MMENTRIGLNAGKVWRILNEKGELSMFELCRELGLTFEEVAVAIGWPEKTKFLSEKKTTCSLSRSTMLNLVLAK